MWLESAILFSLSYFFQLECSAYALIILIQSEPGHQWHGCVGSIIEMESVMTDLDPS